MLSKSKLQPILLTSRLPEAEEFYHDVLGLELKRKSDGVSIFDVNGGDLHVAPVPSTTPSEHTLLGFSVPDVDSVVIQLSEHGVEFEQFEHLPHNKNGTVDTPGGSRVVWIRDPDGNLLSIVQFAK